MTDATDLLGIPVPSTDPIFLGFLVVHVACGLIAVVAGATAMLSRKGRGRHWTFGVTYFWGLFGLFTTMSVLSFIRWTEDYHLFILGLLAFAAAYLGRQAIRRRLPRWHLTGMAASYILMLTAFYVDNGKNLPFWRELPEIALWVIPAIIGVPLTAYYLLRLPRFRL